MRRYGLIGKTLTHSFSIKYFQEKFRREKISDCSYENFELQTIAEFPSVLASNPGLNGVNVTIPYKEEIISYLDSSDEMVKEIGACNCIRITNGKLEGYNTDAIAFRKTLESKLRQHHTNALVLGAGGASKAIQYVLRQLGIEYQVVSRNNRASEVQYDQLTEELIATHTVVINTTPLGMFPKVDALPPIPYQFTGSRHLFYDLTYNPEKTRFLEEGEKKGAVIMNGYEMLVLQAEESWRIWGENRQ